VWCRLKFGTSVRHANDWMKSEAAHDYVDWGELTEDAHARWVDADFLRRFA
jgi:hypothetical protein